MLFRTGSAEIAPALAHRIQTLAQALTKSPVKDLLMAAGVSDQALDVNAYGKTLSVADDDGYAHERRVRLTFVVAEDPQLGQAAPPSAASGGSGR